MIVYSDFNKGRFGNQLFFVASTIGIANKNKTDFAFSSQMGFGSENYQKIFKNKLPTTNYKPTKKYYQSGFHYEDIIIDDAELIGYFQSEKFFKNCEEIIKEQFSFKDEFIDLVLKKYKNALNSISIHVRRGDYINQPNHHPVLEKEYYSNILNNIGNEYENIFVFSDDVDWVKNNFAGDRYIFPNFDVDNDLFCFILMSMCKDNVISNSTYSWWAAWINNNQNKKIYSPTHEKWFGPMYSNLNTKDLLPSDWIKIS